MSRFCLILEPVPLVARDLAATAHENLRFEPLLAKSEAEALSMVESLDAAARLSLAFVHSTAANFASSALRPLLEGRGTKIILLGAEPGADWPVLVSPFSTEQVLDLVASIDRLAQRPAAG